MQYLWYLLAFFLSLGQLGRISFFDQQINIYLFEAVLILITVIGITRKETISSIKKSYYKGLVKAIHIFLGIIIMTYLINLSFFTPLQNAVALLYVLRLILYFHFFIVLLIRPIPNIRNYIYFFILSTIVLSVVQYFLYPNLRNLYYLGWDPHYLRIFGLFFDSTTMGIIFVLSFFYVLFDTSLKKMFKIYTSIFLFILILLTYSRITYISFIIPGIYFLAKKIALWKIGIGVVCFIGILFLLPRPFGESVKLERVFTINARLVDNQRAINLWLKKPIFGYGYNHLRYIREVSESSHAGGAFSSSYLTILVSSGLVGLTAFLYLLFRFYMYANNHGRVYLLVVMVASLFDNVFLLNFIMLFLFLLVVRPEKIKAP